jgi:hypothetical protein
MRRVFSFTLIAAVLSGVPTTAFPAEPAVTGMLRNGATDFDFEIGRWATQVRVRRNPLAPQPAIWAHYSGTTVVKALLNGQANFVELYVQGPTGRIEGGSLRLYNPQTGQWSLNFASLRDGMLTAPVYGQFDGRGSGLFFGQDMMNGRAIMVRFAITQISNNQIRFIQAYSADGGRTWEENWIATDTRK